MYPAVRTQLFAAACVLAAAGVHAQSRGGSCQGGLCEFTGTAIFIVLLVLFLASVYGNIKRKGLVKGMLGHAGIQVIFGYLAMLFVVTGIPILLDFYFGKDAAMWGLGGVLVACFLGLSWLSNRPSRPSSKNKIEEHKQI